MAYTDVSTSKADVPKRTRIVSEQEQAKTDSRRLVRFIFICPVLRCPALPYFSIDSHCDRTDCTVPDPALTDRSSGENKGREHHQAGPRRDQGLESTASRGQVQMITRTTRFLAGMDMYQPLSYGVCSLSQAEVPIGPERHLLPLRCGWRQAQLLRLGRSISCSWTCEKRKTRCCSG